MISYVELNNINKRRLENMKPYTKKKKSNRCLIRSAIVLILILSHGISISIGMKAKEDVEKNVETSRIYYVSKTGNDYNPGTDLKPFKTIQKAADVAIAGDTVYVKQGRYSEKVVIKNSGSPGMYITFAPYPGNTVTIDGTGLSMSSWQGLIHIYGKGYIKISKFQIVNSPQAGIRADKSHHITIEKNYIYNIEKSPIKIGWGDSNNIIIDGNIIDRPYKNSWSISYFAGWQEAISVSNTDTVEVKNNRVLRNGKGECIDLKDGTKHGKVYKNIVQHCSTVGIYIDAYAAPDQYDISVYQNTVRNASTGIMIAAEKGGTLRNIRVYNNLVYNNERPGILISSYSLDGYQPKIYSVSIVNNIVDKSRVGIMIQKDTGGNMRVSNVVIRNNIVSNNRYGQIKIETGYPYVQNLTIDYNLVYGFKGLNEKDGSNVIYADPKYTNAYTFDFRPRSGSPSVDKGSSNSAPRTDFRDFYRPQGVMYDIGAYEYNFQ